MHCTQTLQAGLLLTFILLYNSQSKTEENTNLQKDMKHFYSIFTVEMEKNEQKMWTGLIQNAMIYHKHFSVTVFVGSSSQTELEVKCISFPD